MNISIFANENVVIHGAGTAGAYCARLISDSGGSVLAFIDDDRESQGKSINVDSSFEQLSRRVKVDSLKILIAMPSASKENIHRVCLMYHDSGYDVFLLPTFEELISGKKKLSEITLFSKIDVARETEDPQGEYVYKYYKDKVVLVTGAAGSIGSELCRQLALFQVSKIIAVDHSEYGLYQLMNDRNLKNAQSVCIEPKLGSVCDADFVRSIFLDNKINSVFHAAAYKHVPLMESNVIEGVKNNIRSTAILADAARDNGVERFILVSTDKAVRPTNIMGASKHVAELIIKKASIGGATGLSPCIFSAVRFGNVVGSSGSVVPLFLQQIKAGGPLSLTSKEITRFFMSISDAVSLVLNAGCFSNDGYVYLLDMGEPVKIYELAERLVIMSGLSPVIAKPKNNMEIQLEIIGLRPGEKLYEELLVDGTASPTRHPKIFTADDINLQEESFDQLLNSLERALTNYDQKAVIDLLSKIVGGAQLTTHH